MTTRDWSIISLSGTIRSSQRYSQLWDSRTDVTSIPAAIQASPNGMYFTGTGNTIAEPTDGTVNGEDVTGFNEGIMQVYFAIWRRYNNYGTGAMFFFKASGTIDATYGHRKAYRVQWGGADQNCTLSKRNGTTSSTPVVTLATAVAPRADVTQTEWNTIRISWHWKDASTFNIKVEGDNADGAGMTTLIDYDDTSSPLADDSSCTIGLGGMINNTYFTYVDELTLLPYEEAETTEIVPPPVLPPPPPPVYGSTDEALTRATVVVPVYGSLWNSTLVAAANAVIAEKVAHPSVQMIAIINPANGPGTLPLASIRNFITNAQAAGIVVLAYVSTYYMHATDSSPTRSPFTGVMYTPAKIKADIARYKEYYPTLDGIHYDELSGVSAKLPEYTDITNYARALGYSLLFANPGGAMNSLYYDLFDTFEVYEGGSYPSEATVNTRAYTSDKSKFTVIVHSVGVYTEASVEAYQNHAWGIYVTHTDDYGDISDYLGDLMDTIEAL